MSTPIIYLACPYSHDDPRMRHERFRQVNALASCLAQAGIVYLSPLHQGHPVAVTHDVPIDWDFWEKQNRAFIARSDLMLVLAIDGWDRSVGVKAEISAAQEHGLPVYYFHPEMPNAAEHLPAKLRCLLSDGSEKGTP
jgi:hypothetical protein